MYTFYGNYYVSLCVYIVKSDYLCVYIVICDYLCLFLINVLLSHIIFDRLHCYEVTLVKKYKPFLQKKETKIFDENRLTRKLIPSQRKKARAF